MKFSKKMLSVILAIAMLLSCVTVVFSASAEGEENYKVVIDSTGTLVDGSVDADGYTLKVVSLAYDTVKLYNNNVPGAKALDSAIGKYIELYGENTEAAIYISGNLFTYQFLASYKAGQRPFDKTTQLKSLRIEGYNGTSDTYYVEDFEKLNNLYCDLTIDNITFKTKNDGVSSGAGTLTLGENLSTGITYIGSHAGFVGGNIDITVNSGSYSYVYAFDSQSGAAVNANVNYTLNGGSLNNIYTRYSSGSINGNLKYTFNGGTYSNYIFAASYKDSNVLGNTIFEVNGGNYTKANNDVRVFKIQPGSAVTGSGNLAIILNSHDTTGKCITVYDNGKTGYAEGKKEIVIINNAQNNLFGFDTTLCSDYLLKVTNGNAYPKFSETENPADSVLLGFEISYEDEKLNDIYTPYIGDASLAAYYDEETGLYDLSAYEDFGAIQIEFLDAKELEITTEEATEEVINEYLNGVLPEKDGYLFAGWYESANAEKAMTAEEFAAAETVVAKFIPKAVLDIKWQLGAGANGTADLRLISTVDSLQYKKVIFNVDVVGRATPFDPLESTTVYTGIKSYVDGNAQNHAPTINSASSAYFMTHIIKGIPVDFHDNDFTVTASVVTKDGKVITGDPIKFQLKDATDYDSVMNGTNK